MTLAFDRVTLKLRDRTILDNVSGTFHPGRVTVILGANGAGKSTLLSCLAALRKPQTGTISLDGEALLSIDGRRRAQLVGLLPQRPDIHWNVDVKTVIALGRLPYAGRWGLNSEDHQAIISAMQLTDCETLAHRKIMRLSGGEQGRVLLARVFAGKPKWFLADEPLASLDPAHQFDVLERLRAYAVEGNGVVVVLHDLTQAARFADDVIIIKDGQILAAGAREQVMTADILAQAYGVDVQIDTAANGEPLVVPIGLLP